MPNPIETDFKLALALGRLAGRWGQAEFAVEMIYISLSEMPHRSAVISFSFHKSVATQKDVIFLLVDETDWLNENERNNIKKVVKNFSELATKRNAWIHYPFGIDASSNEGKIYKVRRLRKGDSLYVKDPADQKAVLALANKITDLNKQLFEANTLLMRAYARKQEPQPHNRNLSTLTSNPRERQERPVRHSPRLQSSED